VNEWIKSNLWWICILVVIVFGTGFLTGFSIRNSDNSGLEAELARSENIRRSTDEALIRSERSNQEARIAGDNFRNRVIELQEELGRRDQIIAGMEGQIRDIGKGQGELEEEYRRFITKLLGLGNIIEKLPE